VYYPVSKALGKKTVGDVSKDLSKNCHLKPEEKKTAQILVIQIIHYRKIYLSLYTNFEAPQLQVRTATANAELFATI